MLHVSQTIALDIYTRYFCDELSVLRRKTGVFFAFAALHEWIWNRSRLACYVAFIKS